VTEWIKPIKDLALDQITTEVKAVDNADSYDPLSVPAIATLTDKHVEETVRAITNSSIVRDAWKEGRQLSVYGWVYHVSDCSIARCPGTGLDSSRNFGERTSKAETRINKSQVATAKLRDLDIGFTGPDGARAPSLHGDGRLPSSYAASEDSAHLPPAADSDEE
jgi:hypothetical protein